MEGSREREWQNQIVLESRFHSSVRMDRRGGLEP